MLTPGKTVVLIFKSHCAPHQDLHYTEISITLDKKRLPGEPHMRRAGSAAPREAYLSFATCTARVSVVIRTTPRF